MSLQAVLQVLHNFLASCCSEELHPKQLESMLGKLLHTPIHGDSGFFLDTQRFSTAARALRRLALLLGSKALQTCLSRKRFSVGPRPCCWCPCRRANWRTRRLRFTDSCSALLHAAELVMFLYALFVVVDDDEVGCNLGDSLRAGSALVVATSEIVGIRPHSAPTIASASSISTPSAAQSRSPKAPLRPLSLAATYSRTPVLSTIYRGCVWICILVVLFLRVNHSISSKLRYDTSDFGRWYFIEIESDSYTLANACGRQIWCGRALPRNGIDRAYLYYNRKTWIQATVVHDSICIKTCYWTKTRNNHIPELPVTGNSRGKGLVESGAIIHCTIDDKSMLSSMDKDLYRTTWQTVDRSNIKVLAVGWCEVTLIDTHNRPHTVICYIM